ncbi:hypothetical protein [Paludisphaera mucosa]|uniref:Uncharacterized protein n=1 Tax=Paludisphaera mucosa TaxID=3030827 RepID=A0ABT6FC10_9BACT|nr:hypothetical protein [Paludisphaera mucosa]MDG3005097.1 hypothetical protein [Paludisphaera mucosa]
MPTDRLNDLAAFRAFLDAKLADPGNDLTLAEVLTLWKAENQTEQEAEEAHRTVRDALAEVPANRPDPGPKP